MEDDKVRYQSSTHLKPHRAYQTMTLQSKGQVQLFETIAVLLVFFVIVGLSLTFYFYISKESAGKEHQRALELAAITTAQKVSTLPELDCIQVNVQIEKCFDELKLTSFSDLLSSNPDARDAYFDTIGYANLTIKKIFPASGSIHLYDKMPGNVTSIEKTFLPINLYNPLTKSFGFAILEVAFYER